MSGAHVSGPPWILGHRGAPREAPENTLASLRRALELGLDGIEYDVRACATGDLVVFHDERLERTTDARGEIGSIDLRELYSIDAGGWFAKRFTGESIPVLDEALAITHERRGGAPLHMIELKEPGLVSRLAELLGRHHPPLGVRIASFRRDVVLDARDAGLPTMLLSELANEDDRRFVRDERITAYSVGPGGWSTEVGKDGDWSAVETWAWAIDDPRELLDLCRRPLFGLNTNEPHRALVARALAKLTERCETGRDLPYPVRAPELFVEPETLEMRARGEWFGSWETSATVTNPFPFHVSARVAAFVPHGAFEFDRLPSVFELEPFEERSVAFRASGGAREPGPDPLLGVLLSWKGGDVAVEGEFRAGGQLLFDAPMIRRRIATADVVARRLEMLNERPGDPPATLAARRMGNDIVVSLENPGGLVDAHVVGGLEGHLTRGGKGVRLRLPEWFDRVPVGVPFTCGIEGEEADGTPRLRRWAGGVPAGIGHGRPGLLVPLSRG